MQHAPKASLNSFLSAQEYADGMNSEQVTGDVKDVFLLPTLSDSYSLPGPYPALHNDMLAPSARDLQPSLKAPLPEPVNTTIALRQSRSSTRLRASQIEYTPHLLPSPEASTSKLPLSNAAVHIPPFRSEVCMECLMRDRDMADVDVSTPGVWARASDADFTAALAAEEADEATSPANRSSWNALGAPSSNTHSTSDESTHFGDAASQKRRHRIGRGHALTAPSLKLWTSINGPAAHHRWKTLQRYLSEQAYYLELEQSARSNRPDREASSPRHSISSTRSATEFPKTRARSSNILPSGIIVEQIESDKRSSRGPDRRTSKPFGSSDPKNGFYKTPGFSSSNSSLLIPQRGSPTSERRYSSPMPNANSPIQPRGAIRSSSADVLQNFPRSPSPGRLSIAWSDRPKSTSLWSSSSRRGGGNSANASIYSLAISGSMMDMHLGLSMDRNLPPLPMDTDADKSGPPASASGAKKKKGIKRFISRLFDSSSAPPSTAIAPVQSPVWDTDMADDEPLEPPFPSYFAERPFAHDHSASISSQSSAPPSSVPSPSDSMGPLPQFRTSTGYEPPQLFAHHIDSPLDGTELSKLDANAPLRIVTSLDDGLGSVLPHASAWSRSPVSANDGTLRREKSLPALPPDASSSSNEEPSPPAPSNGRALERPSCESIGTRALSHSMITRPNGYTGMETPYQLPYGDNTPTRSTVSLGDSERIGGGRKEKAKQKSRFFRSLRKSTSRSQTPVPPEMREINLAKPDSLVAFRYPSVHLDRKHEDMTMVA